MAEQAGAPPALSAEPPADADAVPNPAADAEANPSDAPAPADTAADADANPSDAAAPADAAADAAATAAVTVPLGPRVGFVGLGAMGKGMSTCLAGYLSSTAGEQPLLVFNRDAAKAAALVAATAQQPPLQGSRMEAAESLAQVASSCEVVFTMLANDDAVRDVVQQLTEAAAAARREDGGAAPPAVVPLRVIVDCSTVSPDTTAALAAAAAGVGVAYCACPVLGRPDAAAAANLLIFCAGPGPAKQRALPYLTAMGRKVLDLGAQPEQANKMKLLANFHLVSLIELLSEGMTLAEKTGISRSSYMEFIDEVLPVPIVHGYGSRMADDNFDAGAGFTVTLGLKDVNLMRKLGESSGAPLPLADLAFQHLLAAKANGHADRDWSSLAIAVRQAAGLQR